MVILTLVGLLMATAFMALPGVAAKLRTSFAMWLLILLTLCQCLVWRFQRRKHNHSGQAPNDDAAIKSALILLVLLVVASLAREPRKKAEGWLITLSFWIPRKHREAITGDILEDCHEMREVGFGEWRIRIHVVWQLAIGVIMLWPDVIGSGLATVVKHVWKTKQ
jgi:lysylphosphatidylglycerol synthetase-like protein (DUF2156 family)